MGAWPLWIDSLQNTLIKILTNFQTNISLFRYKRYSQPPLVSDEVDSSTCQIQLGFCSDRCNTTGIKTLKNSFSIVELEN